MGEEEVSLGSTRSGDGRLELNGKGPQGTGFPAITSGLGGWKGWYSWGSGGRAVVGVEVGIGMEEEKRRGTGDT